jgi:hypothetical protein
VEIYYVSCRECGRNIEIVRKPRAENKTTTFSATWVGSLECTCGAKADYVRKEVKQRNKPGVR